MSCTSIAETENGETGVLSLSTTFMRQVLVVSERLFWSTAHTKQAEIQAGVGKVSAVDASQIDAVVHEMVYAASQEEYDTTWDSMRRMCVRIGLTSFCEYLSRNWDSCQYMWPLLRVIGGRRRSTRMVCLVWLGLDRAICKH
ncbi:hypothetical protein GQ600_20945 [Phytophthora cactorum]|nr:hypothetical protein GQ600_20945 [Phytophthora cactorum]